MIVCIAGNPSIDKLFEVERLVPGEIHRPSAFVQVPGGKGLNAARAAAALGAEVVATGILGGHAGRWIADALQAEGIPARFAWASGETRSSLSVADHETGRLTEFYEAGARVAIEEWESLEEIVRDLLDGARWLMMSGSVPPGAPVDGYANFIAAAAQAGVRTGLDTGGQALAHGIQAGPDLVKVNRDEASDLLGSSIGSVAEAAAAALELRRRSGGDGHAGVITLGDAGAVMAAPDGTVWAGRVDAWGPYPVGSGDALLGGLAAVLDRPGAAWPVEQALRMALGAAGASAEIPGAGRLDADRARTLAAEARIERRR